MVNDSNDLDDFDLFGSDDEAYDLIDDNCDDTEEEVLIDNDDELEGDVIDKVTELVKCTRAHEIEKRISAWEDLSVCIIENDAVSRFAKDALLTALSDLNGDIGLTRACMGFLALMSGSDINYFSEEDVHNLSVILRNLVTCKDHAIAHDVIATLRCMVEKNFKEFGPVVASKVVAKIDEEISIEKVIEMIKKEENLSEALGDKKVAIFILCLGYGRECPLALERLKQLECHPTWVQFDNFVKNTQDHGLIQSLLLGSLGVDGPCVDGPIGSKMGQLLSLQIMQGCGSEDIGDRLSLMSSKDGSRTKGILIVLKSMAKAGFIHGNKRLRGAIETVFNTVLRIICKSDDLEEQIEAVNTLDELIMCEPNQRWNMNRMMLILTKISEVMGSKPQEIKDLIRATVMKKLTDRVKSNPDHNPSEVAKVLKKIEDA